MGAPLSPHPTPDLANFVVVIYGILLLRSWNFVFVFVVYLFELESERFALPGVANSIHLRAQTYANEWGSANIDSSRPKEKED